MSGPNPSDRSLRWSQLLELLAENGRLTVEDATQRLGVSAATVRRDFTSLADQQLATRTHGGIVATSVAYDLPTRYRQVVGKDAKQRIADAAANRIAAGAVVGINGGTTTTTIARVLGGRPQLAKSGGEPLTIVTNALNIAAEMVLRPHIKTICIGGVARRESYELHGPFAARFLEDIRIDVLILGVNAVTADGGAQCRHLGEAGISAEMVKRSETVLVVAGAEKLTSSALARICPITDVDVIVTDAAADPESVAALRDAGVEVELV